jgi:cysteine desulfurase / selenocysteine lyase
MARTYLDNAATSWPKPETVYAAVDRYQREVGAAAGRGAYSHAVEAQRIVAEARRGCAELWGASDPDRIVFGFNGTDVLNLAIHGLLRSGDHVVTTVCEHNSVLRPLADAARQLGVEVTYVGCDGAGFVDLSDVQRALRPRTRLAAVTHASNVTGAVQPIAEIARVAHMSDALLLVDAAQSAGHVPLDVNALGADLVAASGHKGMLGPLGVGVLYVRPGVEKTLLPVRQGGTGTHSTEETPPDELPHRYEAGNLNMPALAGLAAATRFLIEKSVESIAAHEAELVNQFCDGLRSISGVRVYGPGEGQQRGPVVSLSVEGYDPQDFAAALDSAFGVECRAGLHCAPRMHAALGSLSRGGLVRFSCGWSTTRGDVDRALEAVAALATA